MDGKDAGKNAGRGPEGRDHGGPITGRPAPGEWKRYVKPGLWSALALYALILVLLNREAQEVNFLFFSAQVPLVVLILLSMALGALLAFGFHLLRTRRRDRGEDRPKD